MRSAVQQLDQPRPVRRQSLVHQFTPSVAHKLLVMLLRHGVAMPSAAFAVA